LFISEFETVDNISRHAKRVLFSDYDDGGLHLQNKHLIKKNNKTPCVVIGLTNGVVIGLINACTLDYSYVYFSYIVAVSFIGGGNWSTRRKQPTDCTLNGSSN